jgi:Spy/CpxP family protein refolding chaperone
MDQTRHSGIVANVTGVTLALIAASAIGGIGLACGGSSASSATPATASATETTGASSGSSASEDDESAEGIRDEHRHHHGGVSQLLSVSLETLGVSANEAAQITKIQSDLRARLAPERDAEKSLLTALADGVAAGNVDNAKVEAALAQVSAAAGAAHDASLDALNQLHAVLTPVERSTLADKVEANWQIWRHVNTEEQPGSHMLGDRLTKLADEAELTPDQVITISTTLHNQPQDPAAQIDPNEGYAYVKSFRAAFAGDSFDAKSLGAGNVTSVHMAKVGGAGMVRFYEAATPVLTADQRTKVANQLRERADDSNGNGNGTAK